jgi:hypothetical protein
VHGAVSNQQVALAIIKALGLDPGGLQAVQHEQIQVANPDPDLGSASVCAPRSRSAP